LWEVSPIKLNQAGREGMARLAVRPLLESFGTMIVACRDEDPDAMDPGHNVLMMREEPALDEKGAQRADRGESLFKRSVRIIGRLDRTGAFTDILDVIAQTHSDEDEPAEPMKGTDHAA
jgi:hypothetical protein